MFNKPFLVSLGGSILLVASLSSHAQDWEPPRTPQGRPNLQGVWTNKTLTPLTRSREFGDQLTLSADQARRLEQGNQEFLSAEYAPSDPDREAGAGAQAGNDGDTNDGYNEFWKDVGTQVLTIDGQYRASIIVDPPNGQMPYKGDPRALFRRQPGEPAPYDGPEGRTLAERCLLSFGSHSGPPMLPVMYNNNYQFIQTAEYVVIVAEMVHDARIIRLGRNQQHLDLDKWMGDSIGWWEGDTLVVKTHSFNPQQSFGGASENLVVTEHFSRVSEDQIRYRFTLEDDTVFTQPVTGELNFTARPAQEPLYEYACHEGNYGMVNILRGERMAEQRSEESGQ